MDGPAANVAQSRAPAATLDYATPAAAPTRSLSLFDAMSITVGMVIGAGIFGLPSLVASNVAGGATYMLLWLAGGIISIIGGLCYAELASTYPDAGGDYHFITRAFGRDIAFLFGWARMTIIQTGTIALQGFIVGDYVVSAIPQLGQYGPAAVAAAVVIALTALNVAGIRQGKGTQNFLTICEVSGLLLVFAFGMIAIARFGAAPASTASTSSNIGLAMIFVLYAFGGWNEAAYLSAELRGDRRSILRVLLYGIGAVTIIYLLVNLAMLFGLGLPGIAGSNAVAADLARKVVGGTGGAVVSLMIAIAALSTANATIFTGARTNYALGRDFLIFAPLGRWQNRANTPVIALLIQGGIALVLVLIAARQRSGVQSMVEYTAPTFWFFFLLAGLSLFVLRAQNPHVQRPFSVPFYPVTPLIFCGVCLYMLYSSVDYNGIYSLVGAAVLAAGLPFLFLSGKAPQRGFDPISTEETRPAPPLTTSN